MRLVLDTSVIVSALRSKLGASNALLLLAYRNRIRLLVSPPLFLEYEDVLLRPEQRLVHGLSVIAVNGFLGDLTTCIEPVEIHFKWRPQLIDPGDEMVLEAAINGRAEALVTHNIKHFALPAQRFGILALTPQELLRSLPNE